MPIDPRLGAESLAAIEWLEAPDPRPGSRYNVRRVGNGAHVDRSLMDCFDDHFYCHCDRNLDDEGFIDSSPTGSYVNWDGGRWNMRQAQFIGLTRVDVPPMPPEYTDAPTLSTAMAKELGLEDEDWRAQDEG
jgi:hypothetical protein